MELMKHIKRLLCEERFRPHVWGSFFMINAFKYYENMEVFVPMFGDLFLIIHQGQSFRK